MNQHVFHQFLRFAAVGLSGTAVQYSCVALSIQIAGETGAVTGSAIGYIFGAFVNYTLNYFLTFKSGKSHLEAAGKYFAVISIGWCMNFALMSLFCNYWGWNPWYSQIICTGIGLCWNFGGSRLWAFAERKQS